MELLTKCPKVENTKADGMAAARFPFFAKTHKRVMPDKGGYHMEHGTQSVQLSVNGYEVSASFAECENTEALGKVKQILLSSFAAYAPKPKGGDILALSPGRGIIVVGRRPLAP